MGDSGGPLLFDNGGQWTVIGVLSGGTTDISVYGDISWCTSVAPFRTQIEAVDGVFISVVAEPDALGLMLAGLGCWDCGCAASQPRTRPAAPPAERRKPGSALRRAACYSRPMRYSAFYFAYFWFSHRAAAGEAKA